MPSHRRDRFPLSVSVLVFAGVAAVWPALTAEEMLARRIAFAVALMLLALGMFVLGVQMWSWVRAAESRQRDRDQRLDRRLDRMDGRVDTITAVLLLVWPEVPDLIRRAVDDSAPGREPPVQLASRRRWLPGRARSLLQDHPGAASAAAAGLLIAAGATGLTVFLSGAPEPRHPAGGPEAIRPNTPIPSPGNPLPSGPSSTTAPPTPPTSTVTVTVTAPAIPLAVTARSEYVGVPVAARSQPPPSSPPSNSESSSSEPTTVSGTPAAGEDEPCLLEVGAQCGVTTTSTLIGP